MFKVIYITEAYTRVIKTDFLEPSQIVPFFAIMPKSTMGVYCVAMYVSSVSLQRMEETDI